MRPGAGMVRGGCRRRLGGATGRRDGLRGLRRRWRASGPGWSAGAAGGAGGAPGRDGPRGLPEEAGGASGRGGGPRGLPEEAGESPGRRGGARVGAVRPRAPASSRSRAVGRAAWRSPSPCACAPRTPGVPRRSATGRWTRCGSRGLSRIAGGRTPRCGGATGRWSPPTGATLWSSVTSSRAAGMPSANSTAAGSGGPRAGRRSRRSRVATRWPSVARATRSRSRRRHPRCRTVRGSRPPWTTEGSTRR